MRSQPQLRNDKHFMKPEDAKTSRLLICMGEKARDVYHTFTFETEDDAMKLQPVTDKF